MLFSPWMKPFLRYFSMVFVYIMFFLIMVFSMFYKLSISMLIYILVFLFYYFKIYSAYLNTFEKFRFKEKLKKSKSIEESFILEFELIFISPLKYKKQKYANIKPSSPQRIASKKAVFWMKFHQQRNSSESRRISNLKC